ncbi:MAG: DNA mismatch repair endonuclease MutL, partial [Clostridia bacterium]|nr:DNA mismatch repair endonuclease MutL [Clostridia bacterium]
MSEIRLLDSSVINLIAAGEVVDRPASAVKEMVENAIDAGAKRISVEIRRGGLELIRISDDGSGMTAQNARKAFLKHATSKIATEEDLNQISTLGFRGEALAAISAVSKVTLTTKVSQNTAGTRFEVSEGEILSEEECGCPDGSTFSVQNLFFNTPARLKFMKSEPAEAGAIQSVMERLALSHPQISFRLSVNGTERIHTPGRGDLNETVFAIFGKDFAEMSIYADYTIGDIRVRGLVGKPVFSKANRSRQVFFLNGRYVRSPILTSGLESAYHNKMLIGRMPVCVLFVDLPLSQVDVNVHPSKLEVKFADENAVAYAVRKATEQALASDSGIVEMKFTEPFKTAVPPSPLKKNPYAKISAQEPIAVKQSEPIRKDVGIDFTAKPKAEPKVTQIKFEIPPSKPSGWTITPPKAESKPNAFVLNDVAPQIAVTPNSRASAVAPILDVPSVKKVEKTPIEPKMEVVIPQIIPAKEE